MEETTALFTEALREYNREEMAVYLTQFPDNTAYVYLDDIFNDTGYIELYRMLYPNITYSIQSFEKNRAVIEYTMPNIQKLYTNVSAAVLNLALTDETLQQKLAENDENGIILIREMMLYYASSGNGIENMTQQFTLTFQMCIRDSYKRDTAVFYKLQQRLLLFFIKILNFIQIKKNAVGSGKGTDLSLIHI